MIKFDGLVIVVEPDYKERILKGIEKYICVILSNK